MAALAALGYVPLLLSRPGMVAADTKQYLYLDPGRLMAQALSMWDPSVAAGTVTHQQIGYLLPQGPFYYVLAHLGAPVWVAQRLWMGTLIFLAGAGIAYAVRVLGLSGLGPLAAGIVYELSPYVMQYIERISAILLPFTGLGWMLGFTVLALRRGGWRYPALFAIVVALCGGTNATSLIYAGLAPAAYVVYSAAVLRESTIGRAVSVAAKLAGLSLAVSLWWIAGLAVEGAYGIDVLKYTETVPAIAGPAVPSEILRGLGYWYFYGSDRLGPWLSSAVEYTERVGLVAVSFAPPLVGVIGAAISRFRARVYFILVGTLGLALSVGTHPYTDPSLLGRGLKAFMTGTTAGFALRSTDRATPLVVLALAALAGAGVSALGGRGLLRRLRTVGAAALVVTLAVVNAAPLLTGLAIDPHFERPERLPSYYATAARYLDSHAAATRVLVEPGDDFADYDFGAAIDPLWPGLILRPTLQRQQLIDGSNATADLLAAFDLQLQQGTYDPSTLAPIARLFSAGDVVLQSDYAFWHYNTPRPQETWRLFDPPPPGVGTPVGFGKPRPNVAPPGDRLIDEEALALPASAPWPPPVAVFPVSHPRPIYRAESAAAPLVLDGSGAGVVAAAASGLLAGDPTVIYAGTLDEDPAITAKAVAPGAVLVLTDSNRKELRKWSSVQDNIGATLTASPAPTAPDPTAQPLELFAHARSGWQSVAGYRQARYITASAYGNPVAYTPEDRPYMAFDGSTATAWSVAAFSAAPGNWIQIRLKRPVTTGRLDLVQSLGGLPNRWITKVTISFDGHNRITTVLGQASRRARGQSVHFRPRTFTTLRIRIDATSWHRRSLSGASGVGFSEIGIPGVHPFETIVMPRDLLDRLGAASLSHRLVILMTRQRVGPTPPRSDPEPFMSRSFTLPTGRSFVIGGTARISTLIPDNEIDSILGGPGVFGGAVIGSNERLPGDLDARAVFALDGNPETFWGPGFDGPAQRGAWMQVALKRPISFDHLALKLVADGRHSVPTLLRISTNTGESRLVTIPPVRDRKKIDATVTVPLSFRRVTGSVVRFTVEAVRKVTTINWYSESPIVMPFAIAEMGVPHLRFTPERRQAAIPSPCRDDLLSLDGHPVWLKVTGTVGTAESLGALTVSGCGPDAKGIHLGPGPHRLTATNGHVSGFNLDGLSLDSAPGGAGLPALRGGKLPPVAGRLAAPGAPALSAPRVKLEGAGSTHASLEVSGAKGPFWLVLGESINRGWTARIGKRSLGAPVLIDGFANGWYVAKPPRGPFSVALVWTPQREVDAALVASAAALFACLVLALLPRRRRRRGEAAHARTTPAETAARGAHLGLPLVADGRPAGALWCVLAGAASGAVAYLVLPPAHAALAGGSIACMAALVCRWRGFRGVLVAAAVAGVVAAGVMTAAGQAAHHYPTGDGWPTHFETAGSWAYVGVLALAADAIAGIARGEGRLRLRGGGPGAARRPRLRGSRRRPPPS